MHHYADGARLRRVARYLDCDDFMLTYGDGLSDVDVPALLEFHRAHGRLATVTGVRPPSRFGELVVEGPAVRRFSEKPVETGHINGGFFAFKRRFLDYVTDDDACIAYFRKVVENNPTFFDAHGWIAMAYARKGDMAKSKEAADALLKVDPKRSFQTRRKPMPSAPPAYKKFYDEVYLPTGRKAGVVT